MRCCSSAPTMRHGRNGVSGEAKAKAVCTLCPVRVQCLDYALRNSIRHGIWGGLNEEERARERRRRARKPDAA